MVDIPGNTTTTARFVGDVQVAASCSGVFESTNDSDWIRLDLVAGTTYRFFGRDLTADGVGGTPDLRLFDANGVELAQGGNRSGTYSALRFTAATSGTFFIGVEDLHGAKGDYTVDVVGSNFRGIVILGDEAVDAGRDLGKRFTSGGPGDNVIGVDEFDTVDDIIFGGGGDDTINAFASPNPKIGARDGYTIVHGGDGADRIYGSYNGNDLFGDDGNDVIFGGYAADLLNGGRGADTMTGWRGSDTYHVDNAGDIVDESNGNGLDKVYASISFSLSDAGHCKGKVEDLVLTNVHDIDGTGNAFENRLFGNAGANILKGLEGNDRLDGRGGNDVLVGGAGADQLTGGLGADRFVFNAASDSAVSAVGRDTILDFHRAEGDRIDLRGIDADTTTAGDQSFHFLGTGAFTRHAGELQYKTVSGSVFVYGDVNGDGAADFSIKVAGLTAIQASDFFL